MLKSLLTFLGQLAPTTLPQCWLVSNSRSAGLSLPLAICSVGLSLSFCVCVCVSRPLCVCVCVSPFEVSSRPSPSHSAG